MSVPAAGSSPAAADWESWAGRAVDRASELVTRLQTHTQITRQTLTRHAPKLTLPKHDEPDGPPPEAVTHLCQGDRLRQWMLWSQRAHDLAQSAQDQLRWAGESDPDDLQPALGHRDLGRALDAVAGLVALDRLCQASDCVQLRRFVRQNIRVLSQTIVPRILADLARVLTEWQYPECVLSENASLGKLSADRAGLCLQFQSSWALAQRWDQMVETLSGSPVPVCDGLSLLLQPLAQRFQYHFSGTKKTNSLVRPEWYLQQVKLWLQRSRAFLDLIRAERPASPERAQDLDRIHPRLCQGLFGLIRTKLSRDLPTILDEDLALSHVIDEVLLFTQDIQDRGFDLDVPESDRPIAVLEETETIYLRYVRSLHDDSKYCSLFIVH